MKRAHMAEADLVGKQLKGVRHMGHINRVWLIIRDKHFHRAKQQELRHVQESQCQEAAFENRRKYLNNSWKLQAMKWLKEMSENQEVVVSLDNEHGDIVPAIFCGGNDKEPKHVFLPRKSVSEILRENEAYWLWYGED